ncbi:MAG: PstC family ABC transporter permease, partial [Thermoguttaceae bacterium]
RNYCGLKYIPFFGENSSGFGILTAGLVLALMVLPYISSVMRDVFNMTPPLLREAAYGIGCTRWEVTRHIVLRYGWRGVLGGIFIGLGRALGETMAVMFVIGNVIQIPTSIFANGTTISATLANNFAEADGLMRSVLFALGLVLLVLTLIVQISVQLFIRKGFKH